MTRISRKLLSYILGMIACVAVLFGVLVARPETKTASADTAITFSAAVLGDATHDTYGTSIRFDTTGVTFAPNTYYNWVSAEVYSTIADKTTINGRTVTEINNAYPDKQPITLMMQSAGSFSFLRLYIPSEIMELDDIRSMGILDGWSFTDTSNGGTIYTASKTIFSRADTASDNAMTLVSNYTEITPTIGTAVSGYRIGESLGGDSWVVSIDLGTGATYTEYDLMYNGYRSLRNAICINGKSIDEWNRQAIEENPALGDPSTYLVFPQNSTDTSHTTWFVKPVGLWGNGSDDVVKLTILKGLVADAEEIVVTVGESACLFGQFLVKTDVSTTVHTQTTENITADIQCMTNNINESASYATYYIYTGKTSALWTTSARAGGCLGEADITGKQGGQSLLKYVYFNGTSVWDINNADNGAYDSTQGNIVNGGVYAPIFADLSNEVGGTIKLLVPLHFAGLDEEGAGISDTTSALVDNHGEITLKRGLTIYDPTTGISSYLTNDIVFTNTTEGVADNTRWTKEVKPIEKETEVTEIVTRANRTDDGDNENFVVFQLSNNDYTGCNTTAITDISSLDGYIDIGGTTVDLASYSGEKFFNVWNIQNSVAFRFSDYTALQNVPYITIKAGAKFPSYNTQCNGAGLTYYVTTEDITFIHDVPNDTWTVGTLATETETTITALITGSTQYFAFQLSGSDYTAADDTKIADTDAATYLPNVIGNVSYVKSDGTSVTVSQFDTVYIRKSTHSKHPSCIAFNPDGLATSDIQALKSITVKAGTKFPTYAYANGGAEAYYVTTADITFYQTETDVWSTTPPAVDITDELTLVDQGTDAGRETYMIKTVGDYWTKAPQGGCLNEHDAEGAGGGQEQMKYLYFNGTSLYDINKDDDGSYGSTQDNIASGGIYAPILVTMGKENNSNYSYIQLHVPTEYPIAGATAEQNHASIEIKAGFTVTEEGTTWTVTEDIKWINLNGTWVNVNDTFAADTVTISNPRRDGNNGELYKVDIVSDSWSITCNNYDFMYTGGAFDTYRQHILINGVSVYDINANTDDSAYTYSTDPMTNTAQDNAGKDLFKNPILIETYTGNYNATGADRAEDAAPTNKITLWIHEDYMNSLGNEITITLGAGYNAYTSGMYLAENVSYDMIATVTVDTGDKTETQAVIKGDCAIEPSPRSNTATTIYTFLGWYVGEDAFDFSTPITDDIHIEASYNISEVELRETQIEKINYHIAAGDDADRWLLFYLTEHDYPDTVKEYNVLTAYYDTLVSWGTFDKIHINGVINGVEKEATMKEIFDANGCGEAIFLNIWNDGISTEYIAGTISFRMPGVTYIYGISIDDGCYFPSYEVVSGGTTTDIRYAVMKPQVFASEDGTGMLVSATYNFDIQMADGASVRIKDIADDFNGTASTDAAYDTSGIRFITKVSVADLDKMKASLNSQAYESVEFYTLIVPTSDLMGGQFTYEWLSNNVSKFKNIKCTAGFYETADGWDYAFPENDGEYASYYGSLVKMNSNNYTRWFSGLGYIKIVESDGNVVYVYAPYNSANSRSMAFVAHAAINDRSTEMTTNYNTYIEENNNYSRYSTGVNNFLKVYTGSLTDNVATVEQLDALSSKGGTATITLQDTLLAGPYVTLTYSTNVNVWGVFNYTDGTIEAKEDFYLQAGTTQHTQYLDIFRYNGVAYGMNTANIEMTSITFTNAELEQTVTGNVKILGFRSAVGEMSTTLETGQEIYLTVEQDDGSSMTVGAHLGIGGALTYLAKSGVYEGVIGGSSGWKDGTVAISTDPSVFDSTNLYKSGSYSYTYSTEAGYYGHATSSLPGDGAVNLINNFDAGRQIQQSWYAQVGGSDSATDGSNGYTRAYCYTGSDAGQYWPYNPVQAGDCVSNPGQIVDYEINTEECYIYVKARAMDWAKGYDESKKIENTVEGGVTTKSYMENYYRLNSDGTLYVNNSFVDWNGFTGMEECNWASTELPAVYPVHTLNYYVSNTDGDGTWTDDLEYNPNLTAWTGGTAYHQFENPEQGDTKVEDWFAWANGGDGSAFGMGMYIPNVNRYTSGRTYTSTAYYTNTNFHNSNALPVPEYKQFQSSSYVSMVTEFAQRGNVLADKKMLSNMQPIQYTYQSSYVSNTSYTAPGIDFCMEAYKPIEYTYVIAVDTVTNIRNTFKAIDEKGKVTNAGQEGRYEKVGLDAWARADKQWTW